VKPVAKAATTGLKSPLPGVIMEVRVKEGDTVKKGTPVVVLEAMKMENNIESDKDGVVEKIHIQKGQSVLEGDVLLTIK
jgi:biotin carboxyl carrier protein